MAAGLALGAPIIVPARALGKDGAVAPSNRIVVGHIGCGGMGNGDSGSIANMEECQLVAVCDVDRLKREAFQAKYHQLYSTKLKRPGFRGIEVYHDFRELLTRSDIDAVTISTPDHWHAIISILAAQAGKDIYCQKPLSLTIGEAIKMVSAVRRYGRIFQTGSQQRSHGPFRFACELIRSGYIGKVNEVYVRVSGASRECDLAPAPVPPELDWDFWLGPAPWRPYSKGIHPAGFRAYRDYSGGGMTDWGAHHFDITQWALGMDDSGPVEIIPPDGKQHPLLTYLYPGGTRVYHLPREETNQVNWPAGARPQGDPNGITFIGERGWIEVDRSHIRTNPSSLAAINLGSRDVHLYRSPGHYRDWVQCMRTRSRPVCDVAIGARSVTVCHLGNIAYWLGRPIKWDPANQQVIGDSEAARWIDRPRRAPWNII